MAQNNNIKEFYKAEIEPLGSFGSEQEFTEFISDPKNATDFFEAEFKDKGIFGSSDEFVDFIGVKKKVTAEPLSDGGTVGASDVQSTESETGLFAPLQVPKMFAEKTLKVKETPAPKGQYTLEREGQKANITRDDIFKNLENEEFLKGIKSGEVKIDIQDDEALGNLLNEKLKFTETKPIEPKTATQEDIGFWESAGNSIKNIGTSLEGFTPRLNVLAADIWENVFGKELAAGYYKWEGRDIDQVRNNAYTKLAELEKQMLPTRGLVEAGKKKDLEGIAAGTVDAMTAIFSTAIPSLMTGGAGLVTEMVGGSVVDYNNAKAEEKGITVEELYQRGDAELATPTIVGSISAGMEGIGLRGIGKYINQNVKSVGTKKVADLLLTFNKEGLTELVQTGLEDANNVLAKGGNIEEASKAAADAMISEKGLEAYLKGGVGASGTAIAGRFIKGKYNALTKKNQEQTDKLQQEAEVAKQISNNPTVSKEAKEAVSKEVQETETAINEIQKQEIEVYNSIDDKTEIDNLINEKNRLETIIGDEGITEEQKQVFVSKLEQVNSDIDKIFDSQAKELKTLVSGTTTTPTVSEPIQPTTTTPQEQGVEETVSESVEATDKALGAGKRINEIEQMLALDAKSMQDTGMGMLIPEAKIELQDELANLKKQESDTVIEKNTSLESVDATTKALESNPKAIEDIQVKTGRLLPTAKLISEAYHKAKADGSNPELVKAVEDLLGKKVGEELPQAELPKAAEPIEALKDVESTAKALEGVDAKVIMGKTKTFDIKGINNFFHASSQKRKGRLLKSNAPQFGTGVYFSTSRDLVKDEFGENITNVVLNISNPVYTNTKQWQEVNKKAIQMADLDYGKRNNLTLDEGESFFRYDSDLLSEIDEIPSKFISDAAQELGYDAIIDTNSSAYENEIAVLDDSKIIYEEDVPSFISLLYHKAKADGSNPELVKAVEELLTPKIEQDAKITTEQPSSQMREQSVQETTERTSDSDMPIVNEAELQDRQVVEEEVNEKEGNLVLPKKGEATVKVGEVNAKFKDANKVMGEETTIEMPNGETRQSEYMVVELDDIMASHNEISFGNTDGFPSYNGENANTRNYKGDDKAKARVEENAQKLKPSIVISDTATPDSGVPIISKDGIIVSGNGRAMSIKRAKKQYGDKYDAYKEALIKKAAKFGIDANKVSEMKNPILVKIDNSVTEYTPKVFDDYNKPLQKAEAPIDKAIKRSNIIRGNNTLKNKVLEIVGRHETMSDLFANKADTKLLIENLVSNEVILPQEVAEFVNKDGTLTDSGKDLVNDILIATVLNAETLRATENVKGFRNKLINSLPLLSANYGLGDYSLEQEINDAIKLQSDVAAWGNQEDFWKYINQLGVFDVVNPNTVIINRLINSGKNNFKDFVRIYNQSAGTDEMNLFGAGEVLTKQQIIDNLKKSKLNEDERKIIAGLEGIYDDAIAQRQERDAGVAKEKDKKQQLDEKQRELDNKIAEEIAKKDIDDAKKSLDDNLNKINKLFDKPKDKNDDKIFFQLIPKSIFGLPFRAVDLAEKYIYEKIVVPVGDAAAKSLRKGMESSNVALNEAATQVQGLIRTAPLTTEEITTRRRSIGEINSSILRALRFYENAVNSIGKDAQSLRNVHMVLDPEVYEKMGETPLTYDALNDTEKNLHDLLRATNDAIHDWHFINGKIDKETYDANKGKYIARFYEEIEFDDAPSSFKKTFTDISKQMNFGYVKQRKELDEITLKALEDPVYATARRLGQMLKNQAIIDYSNEASRRVKTFSEEDANIPNNYVKLEGGGQFGNIKIWGDLTNKYVPIDLAEDLKGYMFLSDAAQKAYDFNKAYDRMAIRQFYKKLNTVYNPLVHVGNAVSNFSFAFWTGIDPIGLISNVPQAAKEVRENGDIYLELAREGVVASDVVTKDLTKSSKDILTRTQNANASSNAFRRVFDKFDESITEKYANTDDIAKVAAYITLTKDYKVSPKEAAKRVFDGFQNYSQVGRLYDLTSKMPIFGNPYVKFKADLLRIIKNGLLRKPLTMIGYLMLLKGFADLMSNLADEDEEDRRLREARAFIPKIPFPKSLGGDIPLVFQTKYGEVNAARYFSPFYIYDDVNKSGVLEKASQFAPISLKEYRDRPIPLPAINDVLFGSIAQAIINEDFRGKRIQDPSGTKFQEGVESSEERLINALNYIGRQQVPFYSKTQDIINALNGDPDFYGRNKDLTQSLISSVIKIEQMGNKEISENIQKNVEFAMKDLQALEALKKKANMEYEKKAEEIQNSTKTETQKEKEIKSQIDILTKRLAQLTEKQAKVKLNLLESTNKNIELKQPESPKPQMGLPKQKLGKLPKQKLGQ